jgi:ribonuclease HI
MMHEKLIEACSHFHSRQKNRITLHEAINYVNSDLVSILRYQMYLVPFTNKYLKKFEVTLGTTVKRLAGLAKSTATDLLFDQGLTNVFNLQASVRAEFMQSALQAVDMPCRVTSQISYTHLKHQHDLLGIGPFSNEGRRIPWPEKHFSPLFRGVQAHLNAMDMSLQIMFDTKINLLSREIRHTLAPLAYEHRELLRQCKGLSDTHISRLFKNLEEAKIRELEEISPLFEITIANMQQSSSGRAPHENWEGEKGRPTLSPEEIVLNPQANNTQLRSILHADLKIPKASKAQFHLLRILLWMFIKSILSQYSRASRPSAKRETSAHWGLFPNYTLPVTLAYPDGSATTSNSRAGFGVYFPELPAHEQYKKLSSCIPGLQNIARAESYGVLAALLLTRQDSPLTIHCDRKPLVDQINKFRAMSIQPHQLRSLKDSSLLLRILEEINSRSGTTIVIHVKAHERDSKKGQELHTTPANCKPPLSDKEQHQEYNKVADEIAKGSLANSTPPTIPDEQKHLPTVTVVQHTENDGPVSFGASIFENNPLRLYMKTYVEKKLHFHKKGKFHDYLFDQTIWEAPSVSVLHTKKDFSLRKFMVQIYARTLSTFHRLQVTRAGLFPDSTCCLCTKNADESIEHLFFRCPFFFDSRQALLQKCAKLVKRAPIPVTMFNIRSMLKLMLLNPSVTDERYRSGGQIPIALQTWLQTHKVNDATALRIGKKLHRLIITTYKAFWFDRCTEMREQRLLFKDRLKYFPEQKPIHEMTDEDFVSFAEAWSRKSSASTSAGVAKTHRPPSMPNNMINAHRTFKRTRIEPLKTRRLAPKRARSKEHDAPANGSSHKISKSNSHVPAGEPFHVHDQRFNDLLLRSRVSGDGKCLFRACLRAFGLPDDDHIQL